MTPIDQEYMQDLKALSRESVQQIKALYSYQGEQRKSRETNAKIAIGVIGTYSRMVAAENNREALRLMVERAPAAALPEAGRGQ